jgi:putative oxidoreductase
LQAKLTAWSPRAPALLRIVVALLFIEHGAIKLFGFPAGGQPGPQAVMSLMWIGAVIETLGGVLVLLSLFTRPAAFVMAGEMAVAFWMFHAPNSLYPAINMGDAAILFCFIFLYIAAAGPGPWSVDSSRTPRRLVVD